MLSGCNRLWKVKQSLKLTQKVLRRGTRS
jgi:hypothetical protein